jgi:hypothetical protein
MYWCFHCYATNPQPSGPCVRCGQAVDPPAGLTRRERLEWTLHHPDGDRAVIAARALGESRDPAALPALQRAVTDAPDIYLAATAVSAIVTIAGVDAAAVMLAEPRRNGSRILRLAIQDALSKRGLNSTQPGRGER